MWTNRYHGPLAGNNFATAIAVDTNGNVFLTGSDGGFASTNGGYATIKYSNAGMPLWTNHYNGGYTDNARAVAVDSGGNVIVTGQSYRDFQTSDIVTVAYSNGGIPLWTNHYNGPANGDDVPLTKRSLGLGPNGSVYVTAASDGDFSGANIPDFVTIKYMVSPLLSIARSNGLAVLSWPAAFGNYQLQSNTNISSSNGWNSIGTERSTNSSSISVMLPATNNYKFFRLRSP